MGLQTSITMDPIRSLLAYSRWASRIWSSLNVDFIGTEILPSLSQSKSSARSGLKFFEERVTPKKVVRLPDPISRFFANSFNTVGITGRCGVFVHAGRFP